MNAAKSLITASVLLALGISTGTHAAPQKDEDSAYQWGRWAVLSPAAGGTETFVNVEMPGAVANARPGDADEFTPKVEPNEQRIGIVDIDPEIPVVTAPPTVAPPPPPPPAPPPGGLN